MEVLHGAVLFGLKFHENEFKKAKIEAVFIFFEIGFLLLVEDLS